VQLCDVSQLFTPRTDSPNVGFGPSDGALTNLERQQLRGFYEMNAQRGMSSDAAAMVRFLILHDWPGLCVDTTARPPVRSFDDLKNVWMGLLKEPHVREAVILADAMDEHIEKVRTCSHAGPSPKRDALREFLWNACGASRVGIANQILSEFDAWRRQITHLENAYEHMQPITAYPYHFKFLDNGMASSVPGSPALAQWCKRFLGDKAQSLGTAYVP
jgi:hypothetical protein